MIVSYSRCGTMFDMVIDMNDIHTITQLAGRA